MKILYIAGKVSKESSFATHYRRDAFCSSLAMQSGIDLLQLDPTRDPVDEFDGLGVVGRDCFMMSKADIVIVYLSDDISVGGSQEILIAQYLGKPVIGYAQQGGKFIKDMELYGSIYKDRVHPFVKRSCDYLVTSEGALAELLTQDLFSKQRSLGFPLIENALQYYTDSILPQDSYVQEILQGV